MPWLLAAGGYWSKAKGSSPLSCHHGPKLRALSKIVGDDLKRHILQRRTPIFERKKIKFKTCLTLRIDSISVLRRADICLKQANSIQRKEVIRCLMVQLRGRKIPFGRSAAEHISDAGHGMKATSGSGRPTADPCLRAAGSIQRPFSAVYVASRSSFLPCKAFCRTMVAYCDGMPTSVTWAFRILITCSSHALAGKFWLV